MRRALGTVAIVGGLALIVATFALSLFEGTSSAERMSDRFRYMLSEDGLVELRGYFETVRAAGTEFTDEAIPRIAADLGVTQEQFGALVATEFPAIAEGVKQIPAIVGGVDPIIDQLEEQGPNFRKADAIPVDGVPITVGPWAFLVLGSVLVAGGAWTLRRPTSKGPVTLLAIGMLMAVVPLATSFPDKVAAGDDVADVAVLGLTDDGATFAEDATATLDAMFKEVETGLLPELSRRLRLTPDQLNAFLQTEFPAVATGVAEWPSIAPLAYGLAQDQRDSIDDFAAAGDIPFTLLPWLVIVPGATVAGLAGAMLVIRRAARLPVRADARRDLELATSAERK